MKRQKDRQEQEDVVATLVVQLPSLHEGGDLVVFDDEDATKKYRFDFGKSTGKAALKPSYAVFVAGAEYELEEVKKGYQVEMVYSVRLPRDETVAGVNRSRKFVQKELKEAVEELGGTNETFALLSANEYERYDRFDIEGSQRLAGVDRGRFQALQKANSLVPAEKRLKFYIAKIDHTAKVVKDLGDGDRNALYRSYPVIPTRSGNAQEPRWRIRETSDSVVWFAMSGQRLQNWDWEYASDTFNWTSKLNFLNPDHTSPRTMWSKHIRRNELAVEVTIEYKAYAVVGWPLAHDLKNAATFIGQDVALSLILADEPVNIAAAPRFIGEHPPRSTKVNPTDQFTLEAHQVGTSAIVVVNMTGKEYESCRRQLENYSAEIKLLSASLILAAKSTDTTNSAVGENRFFAES
ncbi:hypothetical protein PHYPSEUDO_009528 [Phytophthora pseudosyringae]|uniref:Uncharacterized protein n=1 Tax=Phytophthora pseudosyringae TaxID=221518 RepID=A0A8T1VH22_9STRA|nr:hypothetical protein PHYPSEUDO_009528 [Phytophthora pseudosyringae]